MKWASRRMLFSKELRPQLALGYRSNWDQLCVCVGGGGSPVSVSERQWVAVDILPSAIQEKKYFSCTVGISCWPLCCCGEAVISSQGL
jgi:hypothetical protein